jgi:hypothetical protein
VTDPIHHLYSEAATGGPGGGWPGAEEERGHQGEDGGGKAGPVAQALADDHTASTFAGLPLHGRPAGSAWSARLSFRDEAFIEAYISICQHLRPHVRPSGRLSFTAQALTSGIFLPALFESLLTHLLTLQSTQCRRAQGRHDPLRK